MPVPREASNPVGRPRSERLRQAVLGAANALVEEEGFSAVSVEAIATRAQTSKKTIYRWWPGKAEIVMDAFLSAATPAIDAGPASSFREEVTMQMAALVDFFRRDRTGRSLTALIAEAQSNRDLAEAIRKRWLAPRRAVAKAEFTRARARGQLAIAVDDDVLIDVLYGALYFRMMFGHAPLDDQFTAQVVDVVLAGAAANSSRPGDCPDPQNPDAGNGLAR